MTELSNFKKLLQMRKIATSEDADKFWKTAKPEHVAIIHKAVFDRKPELMAHKELKPFIRKIINASTLREAKGRMKTADVESGGALSKTLIHGGATQALTPLPAPPTQDSTPTQESAPTEQEQTEQITELKAQLQQTENKNQEAEAKSKPWVSPTPTGYPFFLFSHPNTWSANPNQVMIFLTEGKFLRSALYAKYGSKMQVLEQKLGGYGSGSRSAGDKVVAGKRFRIVFLDKSRENTTKYVLDCGDVDTYTDVLDMAKDSNILVPAEILAEINVEDNRKKQAELIEMTDNYYRQGYNEASAKAQAIIDQLHAELEHAQHSSSDSDAILSGVGSFFGSVAKAFV